MIRAHLPLRALLALLLLVGLATCKTLVVTPLTLTAEPHPATSFSAPNDCHFNTATRMEAPLQIILEVVASRIGLEIVLDDEIEESARDTYCFVCAKDVTASDVLNGLCRS